MYIRDLYVYYRMLYNYPKLSEAHLRSGSFAGVFADGERSRALAVDGNNEDAPASPLPIIVLADLGRRIRSACADAPTSTRGSGLEDDISASFFVRSRVVGNSSAPAGL